MRSKTFFFFLKDKHIIQCDPWQICKHNPYLFISINAGASSGSRPCLTTSKDEQLISWRKKKIDPPVSCHARNSRMNSSAKNKVLLRSKHSKSRQISSIIIPVCGRGFQVKSFRQWNPPSVCLRNKNKNLHSRLPRLWEWSGANEF